ncbi:MAG: hypothetical protein J6Z17_06850 [Treponema sp.]|nr:hypothetical protein [Treponema sp.]
MKKILVVALTLIFSISAYAGANIEVDAGFPLGIKNRTNVKYSWSNVKGERMDLGLSDGYSEDSSGIGLEYRGNFFFVSPNKYIDFGFEAGFGLFQWEKTVFSDDLPGEKNGFDSWSNYYVLLGPVLRINFNRLCSVSFSAGFKPLAGSITFDGSKSSGYYDDCFMAGVDAYFSASSKLWLVSKTTFHFGLNAGINVFTPLTGYYSFDQAKAYTGAWDCEYNIDSGYGANLYLGVCFNFGRLSLDR